MDCSKNINLYDLPLKIDNSHKYIYVVKALRHIEHFRNLQNVLQLLQPCALFKKKKNVQKKACTCSAKHFGIYLLLFFSHFKKKKK